MKKVFLFFVLATLFTGCSVFGRKAYEQQLKSPCVDNGGPCKHIPVNNWWLKDSYNFSNTY